MEAFALWPGGPEIEILEGVQPVSTDSVLLADFVSLSGAVKGADLGCGSGLIALLLMARSGKLNMDLVDISPQAVRCAGENMRRNSLEGRSRVMCQDLRTLREAQVGKYQLIVSNPPYFPLGSGTAPSSSQRAQARMEGDCTLDELCRTAALLLGDGGKLALCVPAARLSQAIVSLSQSGLQPKRLRLVQARAEAAPSLALIECRRGGKPGLNVEPVLIIKGPDGRDTPEIRRIYHLDQSR